MEASHSTVGAPRDVITISKISGRYFLFNIDDVTYLRREHNICGVLLGSLPQIPQQNVFLGLPLELLPEEARVLVDLGVARIVDDAAWHKKKMSSLRGDERKQYLASLRREGLKAREAAEEEATARSEKARAKQKEKMLKKKQKAEATSSAEGGEEKPHAPTALDSESLFGEQPVPKTTQKSGVDAKPYALTPTVSPFPAQADESYEAEKPEVPLSFPLFAHLHARKYFLTPGLRFGCDYTVYPGDPLRFHSHFLAVGYEWEQDIPLLDIIGGGRLGTGVKKGFLVGGEDPSVSGSHGENVRTFCIEWGGM